MLHAAARFNAQKLLINCCSYLFSNYSSVEDNGKNNDDDYGLMLTVIFRSRSHFVCFGKYTRKVD